MASSLKLNKEDFHFAPNIPWSFLETLFCEFEDKGEVPKDVTSQKPKYCCLTPERILGWTQEPYWFSLTNSVIIVSKRSFLFLDMAKKFIPGIKFWKPLSLE